MATEEVQDTRSLILNTAEDIIRRVGFSSLRYEDVADNMTIPFNQASIHYYFKYKVELGLEVVKEYQEKIRRWRADITAQKERGQIGTYYECFTRYIEYWRAYVSQYYLAPFCICLRVLMDLDSETQRLQEMKDKVEGVPNKSKQRMLIAQEALYGQLQDAIYLFFHNEASWLRDQLVGGLKQRPDGTKGDGSVSLLRTVNAEEIGYVGSTSLSIIHGGMIAALAVNKNKDGKVVLGEELRKERNDQFFDITQQLLAQVKAENLDLAGL